MQQSVKVGQPVRGSATISPLISLVLREDRRRSQLEVIQLAGLGYAYALDYAITFGRIMEEPTESAPSPAQASPPQSSMAKTPVSLLQELYVRRGITPKYDLVQIEGAVHEPTFKYRVTVGEFVATGCGQSKKKAKHSAAKAVLEKLRHAQAVVASASAVAAAASPPSGTGIVAIPVNAVSLCSQVAVDLPDLDKEVISPYDDGIDGNPVGELQELCMNRRMPPPSYEVSLEEGQPHERKFVITCSVGGKQSEAGCGKSKKLAKRQAAHKMLKRLKAQPAANDAEETLHSVDDDDLAQGIAIRSSKDLRLGGAGRLYRNLQAKKDSLLEKLQSLSVDDLTSESVKRLEDIGREQDFAVNFVELEELSKKGENMCLVQLSTIPEAVCFGTGATKEDAKAATAFNALEYLLLMTK